MFTSIDSAAWKEHLKDFADDCQQQQLVELAHTAPPRFSRSYGALLANLRRLLFALKHGLGLLKGTSKHGTNRELHVPLAR